MTEMGRGGLRQTEASVRNLGLALMCLGSRSQYNGLVVVRLLSKYLNRLFSSPPARLSLPGHCSCAKAVELARTTNFFQPSCLPRSLP